MKTIKISLKDLKREPWIEYKKYIINNYGEYGKFNPIEVIKKLKGNYEDLSWFIENCELCQTKEMIEYYKSLKPDYEDVRFLIMNCEFCQTKEMIKYYKSFWPQYTDINILLANCKFCRTPEIKSILKK